MWSPNMATLKHSLCPNIAGTRGLDLTFGDGVQFHGPFARNLSSPAGPCLFPTVHGLSRCALAKQAQLLVT